MTKKEKKYVCRSLVISPTIVYRSTPYEYITRKVDVEEFPHLLDKINSREIKRSYFSPEEVNETFTEKVERWIFNFTHRGQKVCKCGNIVEARGVSYGMIYNNYWDFKCKDCLRTL